MDAFIDLLISYGYIGLFIASFIAGSIFPLSSEVVLGALMAVGLNTWTLIIVATIGNWAGTMLNYFIGLLGKTEWIEKYLKIKPEKIEKTKRFLEGKGAWVGFFSFLPVFGELIAVTLGLIRANVMTTTIYIAVGKFVRYVIIAFGVNLFL